MIEIRSLTQLNSDDLQRLVTGYTSDARYQVSRTESAEQYVLTLQLVALSQPYCKRYDHLDAETLAQYQHAVQYGLSFGAYHSGECIGLALTEPRGWHKSLWVWELHVQESYRRQGVGRQLIDVLAREGRAAGLRTVVCETQTTNVPAIRFYQSMGFTIEGIDLSYYSNEDFPDGEVALFMKKRLA